MKWVVDQKISIFDALQKLFPESSKSTLRSLLQGGRVSVSGRRLVKAQEMMQVGQEVEVGPRVRFVKGELRILYEDDQIVVVDKPEGLLSVATDFETRATVHGLLKRRFHARRVYPVHRLDRETSGVMLFVYTETARVGMKEQFEQHTVDKTYIALVEGKLAEKKGSWESYLEEDKTYYVRSTPQGKRALTHYEVMQVCQKDYSLLRLKPETGRKNQLRVHCSESGHPIVGDQKYGAKTNVLGRLALHAHEISFTHPTLQRPMHFSSPVPPPFFRFVDSI
jgi:tRNA pseudouridine32 synthase/23S rRNA pseudouridine746 synthase/23S rRNA pseudouridine1911/1915/1917 synthase